MFYNRFKNFHWSFILLTIIFVFGLFFASQTIWAWDSPTVAPPNGNIDEPINRGNGTQDKTGTLILNNTTDAGLKMQGGSAIRLYDPNNVAIYAGLKAPNSFTGNQSYTLTLPPNDGNNGQALITDGSGNLSWSTASGASSKINDNDNDTYVDTERSSDVDKIYIGTRGSDRMMFDSNGNIGVNNPSPGAKFEIRNSGMDNILRLSRDSSHYVNFGVDGAGSLFSTTTGRAYIFRTSMGGTKNLIFDIDPTTSDVSFSVSGQNFNFEDNININNAKKLKFSDSDNSNNVSFKAPSTINTNITWTLPAVDGSNGQALTTDGSGNLSWATASGSADNDWTINGTYMTAGYNTRIGSGTPTQATGNDDLYVSDTLEVADEAHIMGGLGIGTSPNSTFKLRIAGSMGPSSDNTYDIGSSTNRWANIYGVDSYILNIKLPDTKADKSEGIIYYGVDSSGNPEPFIHNAGYYIIGSEHTNTYVGKEAGFFAADNIMNNKYNVGMGYQTLSNNDSGNSNTAVGSRSLVNNRGGDYNSAFGQLALNENVHGNSNTALGYGTLLHNTVSSNSAFGYEALMNNRTGSNNVALGYLAFSRGSNPSGSHNVGIGSQAGEIVSSGSDNVFIGSSSGNRNTSGSYNSYIGSNAGRVSTGTGNTFIGSEAGYYIPSGNGNILIGNKAGYNINSDIHNQFYIDNSSGGPNFALLYGHLYDNDNSDGVTNTNPFLRVNGKLGISPVNHNFTPDSNSLLHVYRNDGTNSEIRIQSLADSGTFQEHWGIYADRGSHSLRFWNDRGDNHYSGGTGSPNQNVDNILTLDVDDSTGKGGLVGINTSSPGAQLEVHSGLLSSNSLLLSNYDDTALNTSNGFIGGNSILFISGRMNSGTYQTKSSGAIVSAYKDWNDGNSQSDYGSAAVILQTVNSSGDPDDTALIARNNKVGIAGDIDSNRTFRVNGSTRSNDYYSGDDSQGATTGFCLLNSSMSGSWKVRLVFKDGLYICNCTNNNDTCPTSCSCE